MTWKIDPKIKPEVELTLEQAPLGGVELSMCGIAVLKFLPSGQTYTIPLSPIQTTYLRGKGVQLNPRYGGSVQLSVYHP